MSWRAFVPRKVDERVHAESKAHRASPAGSSCETIPLRKAPSLALPGLARLKVKLK